MDIIYKFYNFGKFYESMIYNNDNVRRQDRLLGEDKAYRLIREGEYGVLSMVNVAGEGYGVPLNYVWDEAHDALYIHCAPEGEKLRCIEHHPQVTFTIVGDTRILSEKFTANYESVVIKCHAHVGLSAEERMHALRLIIAKYSPHHQEVGVTYAANSFHRTEVIKLDILTVSGKCKNVKP